MIRKGFIQLTLPNCCPSPKEVRTGTQTGQEPGGRSWCRRYEGGLLTVLLLMACSPCFLIEPGMAPPTTEKMPYSWISWRDFLNWGSFLCDNSSLYQVDTQNQPVHLACKKEKRKTNMKFADKLMELGKKKIILSEATQPQKDKHANTVCSHL